MPEPTPNALIPLPKRMALGEWLDVPPDQLVVVVPRHRTGTSHAAVDLVRRLRSAADQFHDLMDQGLISL